MGNFLSNLANSFQKSEILKHPGDSISGRITKTMRQVIKIDSVEHGKISSTRYPNGTIVTTIVEKFSHKRNK